MARGTFNIPMSDYYSKSSDYKGKVEQLTTDVQSNYLDKVKNNLSTLDGQDQTFMEGVSSYTKAISAQEKMKSKRLKKLTEMSTESEQNPLGKLVADDKRYKSVFDGIANDSNTEAVNRALEKVETGVTATQVSVMLEFAKDGMDSDEYKRIVQLLALDPADALKKLYESEDFISAISKSDKVTDIFLNIMIGLEKAGRLPITAMDKLFDNKVFYDLVTKMSPGAQDKLLDVMVAIQKYGGNVGPTIEKFLSNAQNLLDGKVFKIITDLGESKLGKVLTNPWTGVAISAGFSAFHNYHDKGDGAYGDVGKAAVGGIIDAVTGIGPIDGALLGAQIGGPWGAAIGGFGGLIMWGTQLAWPGWPDKVKDWAYEKYDGVKEWGKGVKQGFDSWVSDVKKNVQNTGKTVVKSIVKNVIPEKVSNFFGNVRDAIDNTNIPQPKLSWFG